MREGPQGQQCEMHMGSVMQAVVTKLKCRVFRHLEMSLPVQMGAEPAPARSLH
jgi:hypothetical protein